MKHHIVPGPTGPYPMNFTTINFVSLDHLVPLLIDFQRRRIADLESGMARIPNSDARGQVERYLNLKRHHLVVLQEMLKGLDKKQAAATVS
jgi:hypothetical protein